MSIKGLGLDGGAIRDMVVAATDGGHMTDHRTAALSRTATAYASHAMDDAEALGRALGERCLKVAFVTCSYDTAYEPVEAQVQTKVRELTSAFGLEGPVRWSLWIVDDLPSRAGFSARIEAGFERCDTRLREASRLRCVPLTSARPKAGGLKGQALLDGMKAALAEGAEVIVYVNLNLKVPAQLAATGLRAIEAGWDAAIGSRAGIDGGRVMGAGRLGRVKSLGYNRFVQSMLPALSRYRDTNAPMKIFTREAARVLVERARTPTVTMDAEWLLLLHEHGFETTIFPVVWSQRKGSRPPWTLIPACAWDVMKIKRRWQSFA